MVVVPESVFVFGKEEEKWKEKEKKPRGALMFVVLKNTSPSSPSHLCFTERVSLVLFLESQMHIKCQTFLSFTQNTSQHRITKTSCQPCVTLLSSRACHRCDVHLFSPFPHFFSLPSFRFKPERATPFHFPFPFIFVIPEEDNNQRPSHSRVHTARPPMSAPTHEGAVMDYLVLGPEGSGKRTLAALLAHSGGLSTLDIPAPAAFQEPCVTHIRLPSEGSGDDDDYQDEYEDASPAEITVTTVPASWWSAALQPGSPEATRLDALCTRKDTPFAAVFVVPLDAYCTDDSGFAPLHEDRSVQEDKEDEKKEEKEGSGTGGVAPLPSLSFAPTAPVTSASVGVPSLLARRRAAAAAAAANAQTAPAVVAPSRGRRCLALSVDTAPLTAGARAVRDDVCETPTTCTDRKSVV